MVSLKFSLFCNQKKKANVMITKKKANVMITKKKKKHKKKS